MKRAALLVLLVATTARADDRVASLSRALAAVHDLGPAGRDRLEHELRAAARARCRADSAPPTASCLVDAATASCAGAPACEAAADVAITNARAEPDWIDDATRAHLVRSSADYRVALAAELHRRYAALAAELVLVGGSDAAAIDRLCRERDRRVHACADGEASCVPSLPWSRCVAALVWFVGGAR